MGMIGIVVVGDDKTNLDKIKKVKLHGKSKKIFSLYLTKIIENIERPRKLKNK